MVTCNWIIVTWRKYQYKSNILLLIIYTVTGTSLLFNHLGSLIYKASNFINYSDSHWMHRIKSVFREDIYVYHLQYRRQVQRKSI